LKRLEAAGLITRTRQAGDERSVRVSLTAAGREMEVRVADAQVNVGAATGMSRAEIGELRATLHLLSERLRAAAGPS
jgi:MarR family transcriptional regulator, organic hydroperoxide resistance regulator